MSRDVKFDEVLRGLIEAKGLSRNRAKILDALGDERGRPLSSGALSQYLSGTSRPSFERLVKLADFLGVTLDYLVHGRDTGRPAGAPAEPMMDYMRELTAELQTRSTRHTAVVSRLARALGERLDEAALSLTDAGASPGGMLSDDDTARLEELSQEVDILTLDMSYDLSPGSASGVPVASSFTWIVARNLSRDCRYRFLLPGEPGEWAKKVAQFYETLCQLVPESKEAVYSNCTVKVVNMPAFTGLGFHKINEATLRAQERLLLEQIRDYISADGWLGYIIPPNPDFRGDLLISSNRMTQARKQFETLWLKGKRPA